MFTNLAAAVFRLERTGAPAEHLTIARLIASWLRGEGRERIIAAFNRWWTRTLSLRHNLPNTLNPFAEDPMLTTRIEQWTAQVEARGEARGKAEGKAEGTLAILRRRIARGTLTIDDARAEVQDLRDDGGLTGDEADRILTSLG